MEYVGSKVYKPEELDFDYSQRTMYISKHLLDDIPTAVLDSIKRFEPEWIKIQPSTLVRLTDIMKTFGMALPTLRYIELIGEMVRPGLQKAMEEYWHVPVINMYGAAEVNTIALECPFHRLHVLENNVYLEPYEIDGKASALVTGLHNSAMPIIRYSLGDELIIHETEKCSCGVESSYISEIKGRTTDVVILGDNKYVSPYIFVFCIDKINSILNNPIIQFKILQKALKEVCFYLVLDESFNNWQDTIRNELYEIIKECCGDLGLTYNINFLDEIKGSGDKYKFFECSLNIERETK
jgi:phenylacetate-CoA ligase